METKTTGLEWMVSLHKFLSQQKFTHLVIDFSAVTHWWNRLWAVVQIPIFLLVYIIKGKATLH